MDIKNLIILDCESSGIYADSYPISIGIAGADGLAHSWLIEPLEHWDTWCDNAEAIHKIPRETLIEAGRDPWLVARELNSILNGTVVYADSDWDAFWINRLFEDVGVTPSFKVGHVKNILSKDDREALFEKSQLCHFTHDAKEDAEQIYSLIKAFPLLDDRTI